MATVVVSRPRAGVCLGLPVHSPRKLLQLLKLALPSPCQYTHA